MRPFQHQLPSKGNFIDLTLHDMMDITAQLNSLLKSESELLGEMRMKELSPLQAEKKKLSEKLEGFQKLLATDDTIVRNAGDQEREELLTLTDELNSTIEENMRRTMVAQNVNQRVLRALTEAMTSSQRTGAYGSQGQVNVGHEAAISINLNERA